MLFVLYFLSRYMRPSGGCVCVFMYLSRYIQRLPIPTGDQDVSTPADEQPGHRLVLVQRCAVQRRSPFCRQWLRRQHPRWMSSRATASPYRYRNVMRSCIAPKLLATEASAPLSVSSARIWQRGRPLPIGGQDIGSPVDEQSGSHLADARYHGVQRGILSLVGGRGAGAPVNDETGNPQVSKVVC